MCQPVIKRLLVYVGPSLQAADFIAYAIQGDATTDFHKAGMTLADQARFVVVEGETPQTNFDHIWEQAFDNKYKERTMRTFLIKAINGQPDQPAWYAGKHLDAEMMRRAFQRERPHYRIITVTDQVIKLKGAGPTLALRADHLKPGDIIRFSRQETGQVTNITPCGKKFVAITTTDQACPRRFKIGHLVAVDEATWERHEPRL